MKKATTIALALSALGLGTVTLSGCSTMSTYMKHKDLSVQTKTSETIFLDPVPQSQQVVYVQVKNTTSENLDGLKDALIKDLQNSGWTVTNDLDKAYTMIQVNVLQAGEAEDPNAVWGTVSSGYGNIMTGGLAGVATGALTGNYAAGAAVGVGAGVADWVGSQMVTDKLYSVITDVQVSRKVDGNVKQVTQANLAQGSSTATSQSYEENSNWLRYRTRIGTLAEQVNLTFEGAAPKIEEQQAKQISGILG